MEKVTTYKAFNGRLFLHEEDCLKYEKKMSGYPKIIDRTKKADDVRSGSEDNMIPVEIIQHIVETKQTPSSEKKKEIFYVVGGKYKLTGTCKDDTMLHHCADPYSQDAYSYWGLLDKAVAEYILNGGTIDSHSLSEICDNYHKRDKYSQMRFEVIEPLKKWRIEDIRWHNGSIAPFFVIIEKI